MQGAVGCASEPWLFKVPALDRGKGLILWYVVSKYCCVKPLYLGRRHWRHRFRLGAWPQVGEGRVGRRRL